MAVDSAKALAETRTDYARERTRMAATRTFFALLRTGLAIAGGGTLITTILAKDQPDWVVALLAGVFIVCGFAIVIAGLQRYRRMTERLQAEDDWQPISLRLMTTLTIILQLALIAALLLFLIG